MSDTTIHAPCIRALRRNLRPELQNPTPSTALISSDTSPEGSRVLLRVVVPQNSPPLPGTPVPRAQPCVICLGTATRQAYTSPQRDSNSSVVIALAHRSPSAAMCHSRTLLLAPSRHTVGGGVGRERKGGWWEREGEREREREKERKK